MNKIEVIVVTGMSGAGKTQAMAIFENMEYRCIDNYPIPIIKRIWRFNAYFYEIF